MPFSSSKRLNSPEASCERSILSYQTLCPCCCNCSSRLVMRYFSFEPDANEHPCCLLYIVPFFTGFYILSFGQFSLLSTCYSIRRCEQLLRFFHLDGEPSRMYCNIRYPFAKGVRDYFANDVITAIDIGMVAMSIGTAEQTPMDPLAQIVLMLTQFLPVQKATLAGVGLFGDEHMYPYELRFVGQHLEKASVWNVHKILIVPPANVDVLLP